MCAYMMWQDGHGVSEWKQNVKHERGFSFFNFCVTGTLQLAYISRLPVCDDGGGGCGCVCVWGGGLVWSTHKFIYNFLVFTINMLFILYVVSLSQNKPSQMFPHSLCCLASYWTNIWKMHTYNIQYLWKYSGQTCIMRIIMSSMFCLRLMAC